MRPRSDTLLVWTGAPCSYGCGACPIDPNAAPVGVQFDQLQRALSGAAGRLAVLVGGEPFLRPDFLRLVAAIRAAGCRTGIITTGRPLIYPHIRARLRRAGLTYLRVQFFGHGEEHDRATAVPGGFDQAVTGLRAWVAEAGQECDVDVALTIRRRSMETLVPELERLAREVPAQVQIVIAVDAAARADPHQMDALGRAGAALANWNADESHQLLAWEGLPDLVPPASCLTIPTLPTRFVGAEPRACCLGVVDEIADAASGGGEKTRANSFNFIRTGSSVAWTAAAADCTAHQAANGADSARQLWLVEDDRLVLHVTDTGDFGPAEIARVKDEWSHVFLDRAPAGVLDDFTEGMRRVVPDATCEPCPHRVHCGRRFRLVEGAPYAREEARIAAHIAGLRGRVLDVGCGEQLYRDSLEPLVRSGVVQYTGLDPDALSIARLREALPQGRFLVGGIEDVRGEPASYDHILCLRSLNHVSDVDEALARMAELLKPGGQLLIVECTPFAMLRRPEQVAAADHAPRAGHQHFRNVASDEVVPFARRRALQVIEHHPASLPTTNEWILLLGRPPGNAE
jgi:MoaA/NifB/PqqE/SkfB family radical SAM enzyme